MDKLERVISLMDKLERVISLYEEASRQFSKNTSSVCLGSLNISFEGLTIYKIISDILGSDIFADLTKNVRVSLRARLIIQKTIYILQELTGKLYGGIFSWHLHGPYSPFLTNLICREILPNLDILHQIAFKINLTTRGHEVVEKIRTIFSNVPAKVTEAEWYELISSVRYLSKAHKTEDEKRLVDLAHEYINIDCIEDAVRHYLNHKALF